MHLKFWAALDCRPLWCACGDKVETETLKGSFFFFFFMSGAKFFPSLRTRWGVRTGKFLDLAFGLAGGFGVLLLFSLWVNNRRKYHSTNRENGIFLSVQTTHLKNLIFSVGSVFSCRLPLTWQNNTYFSVGGGRTVREILVSSSQPYCYYMLRKYKFWKNLYMVYYVL
jgi:hypothetical protein